jgi:DNA-binding transcriptional regulator YdaS (Cro superfamily)
MTLDEAIAFAGNKSKLASLLGVTRSAVTQWKELPKDRLEQLNKIREQQTEKVETGESQ